MADLLVAMCRERRHMVLVSAARRPLGVVTLDDGPTPVVGRLGTVGVHSVVVA
ncbi:hypothetical protein ACQSSU_18505 [Micromonospora echinospora]